MTDALKNQRGTVTTGDRIITNQCRKDQVDDSISGINKEIKVNGQKLERVTSFKYLGSVITAEGSKPEILSTIPHPSALCL